MLILLKRRKLIITLIALLMVHLVSWADLRIIKIKQFTGKLTITNNTKDRDIKIEGIKDLTTNETISPDGKIMKPGDSVTLSLMHELEDHTMSLYIGPTDNSEAIDITVPLRWGEQEIKSNKLSKPEIIKPILIFVKESNVRVRNDKRHKRVVTESDADIHIKDLGN